ncbi:histidine--tRNA ligase [Candidatus Woesearchaeota archaeon]|nr:histidine--tRNA ligase [Candidatus Woesearchaeota archaeon]
MTYQRIRGAEDYYPNEFAVRKAISDVLAEEAKRFGFSQVDSPAIETIKLLTAKSGEEIKQQIFVMEQRGSEELGLRFDLTVPMTRMFVTKQREMQKPVKWFALAPMWRYEAPQKGRAREFMQLSCELFGSDKPEADAACINLIIACLERFGLSSKEVTIKINNRKLLEGLLSAIVPAGKIENAIQIIDRMEKVTDAEFFDLMNGIGVDQKGADAVREIVSYKGGADVLKKVSKELKLNELATQGLNELQGTLDFVDTKYITVDLSIARGLAYYTGNVYECFDREGKYRALAGGGRYDELVGLFGGEKTPATGFAIGLTPLTVILTDKGLLPAVSVGPEYYVAPVDETVLPKAMEITAQLRKRTTADVDLMRRKLGKQLDYAAAIGATKVVIVGEKDLKEGKVTVRDLKNGKEEKVLLTKLH